MKFSIKSIKKHIGLWEIIAVLEFVVIVGLASFLVYERKLHNQPKEKPQIMSEVIVETAPVKVGDFIQNIKVVGTLRANQSVIIRPEIEGKISKMVFQSGNFVKKGDLLVELEKDLYEAKVKQAQASLDLAKANFTRAKFLHERKAGTTKDLEKAQAELKAGEAELASARAQLKKTTLRAPFEGYIGLQDHSVGAYVKPGEDLVTVDDVEPMKVDFKVSETYIDRIKVGEDIQLDVEGFPHAAYTATIEAIDPKIDPITHTVNVRASFSNVDGELRAGLYGTVTLPISRHEDALLIPEAVLESEGADQYVFVVQGGHANKRLVKTGGRDGANVEVLMGIKAAESVIVGEKGRLVDGIPVVVLPPMARKGGL